MSSISARLRFLVAFGIIKPEAQDAINPHGYKFGKAIKEYMIAGIVRDIAGHMHNRELAQRALKVGSQMVEYAASNLINGWEDGDDICPPWHIWHPIPFPEPDPYPWYINALSELNPQPLPPRQIIASLKVLADLTSVGEAAEQLHDISNQLGQYRLQ